MIILFHFGVEFLEQGEFEMFDITDDIDELLLAGTDEIADDIDADEEEEDDILSDDEDDDEDDDISDDEPDSEIENDEA